MTDVRRSGRSGCGDPEGDRIRIVRRVRLSLLGALALVLISFSGPTAAFAQGSVELSIDAGYGNRYVPGHWMPVSVTVESSQAFSGELEVSFDAPDGTEGSHSMGIELPGGGRKRFHLLVPGPLDEEIVARVLIGDDAIETSASLLALRDAALVGVLNVPEPPSLQGIAAEPTLTEMIPVALPADRLALGASALEPLSYVVAEGADLSGLPDEHRNALLDWVSTGGRLIVAATDPEDAGGLESATGISWDPSGRVTSADRVLAGGRAGVVEVGLGELIVIAGNVADISRPDFESLLRAAPVVVPASEGAFFNDFGNSPEMELARAVSRGGSRFQIGWFVGFLVAYLVLVGPVNYFVLRRRGRKELLWVTVPVLALAFSGVAYGLARGDRGALELRTAGIVFATSEGQRGMGVAMIASGGGGERTISFPTAAAVVPGFVPFTGSSQRGSTRITPSGAEASIDTAPFSLHVARGTIEEFEGYLEATIAAAEARPAYKVTNRTPYAVEDVTILHENSATLVGDLGPGETSVGFLEANGRWRFPRGMIDGGLRRALDFQMRTMLGPRSFGSPYVVASVEDHVPGIALDGGAPREANRFMVGSPVELETGSEATEFAATLGRMSLVAMDTGNVYQRFPGLMTLEGFEDAVLGYQAPAGLDPDSIVGGELKVMVGGPRQNLERYDWESQEWIPIAGRFNRFASSTLPAEAFSEAGEAFFRFRTNRHGFVDINRFELQLEIR